jgi:transcriptional regulator with XRE-family HTH domain
MGSLTANTINICNTILNTQSYVSFCRQQYSYFIASKLQRRVAFLPFVSVCLKRARPKPYPENPVILGEHLKKRRMELGLLQREVAKQLGIGVFTYLSWERGGRAPFKRYWPGIITFLGHDPSSEARSLGERISAKRRELGLTQREVAQLFGWDHGTLYRYERDEWKPGGDRLRALEAWLATTPVESSEKVVTPQSASPGR